MKKVIAILFLFSFLISGQAQVWTVKAQYGTTGRTSACGFSLGTFGFIGLGYDDLVYKRSFKKYDPVMDTWTQVSNFADPGGSGLARDLTPHFQIGNCEYFTGGQGVNTYFKDVWEYYIPGDSWLQKASNPGSSFRGAVGLSLNGKGYIICGQDSNGLRNDVWEFDVTTNSWTQMANFAGTPRRQAVGFVVGTKGYVCTGDASDGYKRDLWEFDPIADTWAQRTNFPGIPRYGAVSFVIGNRAFVGLGYDSTMQYDNDFWEYNTSLNAWSSVTAFPWTPRSGAAAFTIGNKAYVGTGYNQTVLQDFWEFDPSTITFDKESVKNKLILDLYQNSFTQELHIHVSDVDQLPLRVELYDVSGKMVQNETINTTERSISLKEHAMGVFIVNFIGKTGSSSSKKIFLVN